jgi:hypothetical protein
MFYKLIDTAFLKYAALSGLRVWTHNLIQTSAPTMAAAAR